MHIPLPIHARTGLAAIGFRKPRAGEFGPQPIWPVKGGSQPEGEPPTPPANTPPPAQPQVPTPAQVFPPQQQPGQQPAAQPVLGNGENGFPENTPLAQMTGDQREAYWRHYARKHEQRANAMADYDQLKAQAARLAELEAATMTETQKAVAEAEQRGRAAALAESGSRIVDSMFRAALHNRLTDDQVNALVAPLDRKTFLTADGLGVDTDKVTAFVNVVAPPVAPATAPATAPVTPPPAAQPATGTPQPRPDMGQGNRTTTAPSGLAAGAEIAKSRAARRIAPPVIAK